MKRELIEWVWRLEDCVTLTTGQVAAIFEVDKATVWRWCTYGKIKALRTPGGVYRIPVAEVKRILREWGYTPEKLSQKGEQT